MNRAVFLGLSLFFAPPSWGDTLDQTTVTVPTFGTTTSTLSGTTTLSTTSSTLSVTTSTSSTSSTTLGGLETCPVVDQDSQLLLEVLEEEGFDVTVAGEAGGTTYCSAEGEAKPAVRAAAGKPCCFCEYYNHNDLDKRCESFKPPASESNPLDPDCRKGPNGKYFNRFYLGCSKWIRKKTCSVKKILPLNGPDASKSGLGPFLSTNSFACKQVYYHHDGHRYGAQTFFSRVDLCLEACPNCTSGNFFTDACLTFSDLATVQKEIQALAAKLNAAGLPLQVILIAHQGVKSDSQDCRMRYCLQTGKTPTATPLDKCFKDKSACKYAGDQGLTLQCLDEKAKITVQTCCQQPDKSWIWERGRQKCKVPFEVGIFKKGGGRLRVQRVTAPAGNEYDSGVHLNLVKDLKTTIWLEPGVTYRFTAFPAAGYKFVGWGTLGDGGKLPLSVATGTLVATQPSAVMVVFAPQKKH